MQRTCIGRMRCVTDWLWHLYQWMPTSSEDHRSGNSGVTDGEEDQERVSVELIHFWTLGDVSSNECHGPLKYFMWKNRPHLFMDELFQADGGGYAMRQLYELVMKSVWCSAEHAPSFSLHESLSSIFSSGIPIALTAWTIKCVGYSAPHCSFVGRMKVRWDFWSVSASVRRFN